VNRIANQAPIAASTAPMLMIVFREKYSRWWYDWNLNLARFTTRVTAYVALMDDRYPATDEDQSVRLTLPYPNLKTDLNRWLPIVKWLLAIPHYIILSYRRLVRRGRRVRLPGGRRRAATRRTGSAPA
jgi:hypothetical protein